METAVAHAQVYPVATGSIVQGVAIPLVGEGVAVPLVEEERTCLKADGYPTGLSKLMGSSCSTTFPIRFVIVDNSGSMATGDGTRYVGNGSMLRKISSTRWDELRDEVSTLAGLATKLQARTDFLLLNPPPRQAQFVSVGGSCDCVPLQQGTIVGMPALSGAMATSPTGSTPLTEAVSRVAALVERSQARLVAHGQSAVVVIATDGLPNDKVSFLAALKRLSKLSVWVVVRLCTNQDEVVDYWSGLDRQLESPLEVLDDLHGESSEVFQYNSWVTYGAPLHHARLFGLHQKVFDLLDEQTLVPSQSKQLCEMLLGCSLPEPDLDLPAFISALKEALGAEPHTFDPRSKMRKPWIDVAALNRTLKRQLHGDTGCLIC